MSTKPDYPEHMPVLHASDINRGSFSRGKCRCLTGWINEATSGCVFFSGPGVEKRTAASSLRRAVIAECEAIGLVPEKATNTTGKKILPRYNDNKKNSLEDLATAFNQGMRKKGYIWEMDR